MLLEIKKLSLIKDNKKILDDINLDIDFNKFIVITGPNGSGKSSLLKAIVGLEKPTTGQTIFYHEDFTNKTVDERCKLFMAYAFQNPVKFKGITVYEMLKLSYGNITKKEASKILQKVGLNPEEYLNRELDSSLSGGEHKRIEIATIINSHKLLTILDEPEAGIDLWSFNKLIDLFKSIKGDLSSVIIVSHQDKILKMADQVILLEKGQIKKIGTYEEVMINE